MSRRHRSPRVLTFPSTLTYRALDLHTRSEHRRQHPHPHTTKTPNNTHTEPQHTTHTTNTQTRHNRTSTDTHRTPPQHTNQGDATPQQHKQPGQPQQQASRWVWPVQFVHQVHGCTHTLVSCRFVPVQVVQGMVGSAFNLYRGGFSTVQPGYVPGPGPPY